MSYDLLVWEGDRPANDEDAAELVPSLCEQYLEESPLPPTPSIAAYVQALIERYPELDVDDNSPWTGPLLSDASGPIVSIPIRWDRQEDASAWAAQLAHDHGLVCFDPQLDRLRP